MARQTIVDRDRVVAALDEEWDALTALGGELSLDDWDTPTDCPGWSVKDNYAHIIGTESILLGRASPQIELPQDLPYVHNDMGRFNEVWVQSYRDTPAVDLLAELAGVIGERRAALARQSQEDFDATAWTPAGEDTHGRFMAIRVLDQWFHEQDVREAVGRPGHVAGLAPEVVLEEIGRVMGYVVGKQAGFPSGTSLRIELAAPMPYVYDVEVTDRARLVDALLDEPRVTVTMPGSTFCRLAGGRRRWVDAEITSVIATSGDQKLAEQLLSNVAFML